MKKLKDVQEEKFNLKQTEQTMLNIATPVSTQAKVTSTKHKWKSILTHQDRGNRRKTQTKKKEA